MVLEFLRERWIRPQGYREVLALGLPLVVSMASTTVMEFTDRIFLSRYSVNAIAAAMPAGIAQLTLMAFFVGLIGYVSVFVAQYIGSGAKRRVGAALWHGIYITLLSGLAFCAFALLAEPLFNLGGHPSEIRELEITYFRILNYGAVVHILGIAFSSFFSGRGVTRPVMLCSLVGAAVNIPLDYALIYGVGPFPEWGITGAALATATGWAITTVLLGWTLFKKDNEVRFGVWSERSLDLKLFGRLIRYGLPGGIQMFMEILSFSFFLFMIGRLGKVEMAATSIAFSIDSLAFLPMVGFNIGVSAMVGQAIGRKCPEDAVRSTMSALHVTLGYMGLVALTFVLLPGVFMDLFRPQDLTLAEFEAIRGTGVILLRFVALYSLFDAVGIILFGAIRGAGDTAYAMWAMGSLAVFTMVIPLYFGIEFLGMGLYGAWFFITLYIAALAAAAGWRFNNGKWKSMRVIEAPAG